MTKYKTLFALALATVIGAAQARTLLDVKFAPRAVQQIEIGDFHFTPGQKAPIHTHTAPAYGYVSKGSIYYEVEGRKPVLLKAGDVFFEPVGPRILHFDNASATEEAVFTDFNPERSGEPFIVFPKPPIEKIDRRSFPTVAATGSTVSRVTAADTLLTAGTRRSITAAAAPVTGYVAGGMIELRLSDGTTQTVAKGASFGIPAASTGTVVATGGQPAKIVTFVLSSSK